MHDAIVVGGGPAGSLAASLLAEDHDVLMIEEHEISGSPIQCTGLVTDRTVALSGVKPIVLNTLYGANVFFPNGRVLRFESDEPKALLIDRGDLDKKMADAAVDAGVSVEYGKRYSGHKVVKGVVEADIDGSLFKSKLIVGADGHASSVSASIPDNQPTEYVRGIQYDIRHRMEQQDLIDIRIGTKTAPGFFSWEIPFGEYTRVGLCTSWSAGPPMEYLKALLRRNGLDDCKVIGKYSGRIPIGKVRRTFDDNLMLIGDAACQVKPISGGGLYPAFTAAKHLRDTAEEAFEKNDFSSSVLYNYQKRWKKEVGKELKRGYSLRKIYSKLTDDELNKIQKIVDDGKMVEKIHDFDIDAPSELLSVLMKNTGVCLKLVPTVMKGVLRG